MNTYKFIIGYIVVSTALMVILNKLNMEGVDETLAEPVPEETTEDSGMETEAVTMEEEPPIVSEKEETEEVVWVLWLIKLWKWQVKVLIYLFR